MSCDLSARSTLNRMRLDAMHIPVKERWDYIHSCISSTTYLPISRLGAPANEIFRHADQSAYGEKN
jgi:hypothetical protein